MTLLSPRVAALTKARHSEGGAGAVGEQEGEEG